MALSVSTVEKHDAGDLFSVSATITFDSSYPTGGESLSASALGLTQIHAAFVQSCKGYAYDITPSSDKTTATILVYYADYNATGDGAFIQVPDTTNLATLAPKIVFFGK